MGEWRETCDVTVSIGFSNLQSLIFPPFSQVNPDFAILSSHCSGRLLTPQQPAGQIGVQVIVGGFTVHV